MDPVAQDQSDGAAMAALETNTEHTGVSLAPRTTVMGYWRIPYQQRANLSGALQPCLNNERQSAGDLGNKSVWWVIRQSLRTQVTCSHPTPQLQGAELFIHPGKHWHGATNTSPQALLTPKFHLSMLRRWTFPVL